MELIYDYIIDNNKPEFIAEVKRISPKLNISPHWLMAVMYIETGATFNPAIQNLTTGATGLIQFMPATAAELGTTTTALAQMTNVEQLEYVYQYLRPYRNKMNSFLDCYLAVFFPAAIGKNPDWVLQTGTLSAATIARQNPLFDLNKDNKITVSEIETALLANIRPEYHIYLKKKTLNIDTVMKYVTIALAICLILSGSLQLYKIFKD